MAGDAEPRARRNPLDGVETTDDLMRVVYELSAEVSRTLIVGNFMGFTTHESNVELVNMMGSLAATRMALERTQPRPRHARPLPSEPSSEL